MHNGSLSRLNFREGEAPAEPRTRMPHRECEAPSEPAAAKPWGQHVQHRWVKGRVKAQVVIESAGNPEWPTAESSVSSTICTPRRDSTNPPESRKIPGSDR